MDCIPLVAFFSPACSIKSLPISNHYSASGLDNVLSSVPHTSCPGASPYSKHHFNCSELAGSHDLWWPQWPFMVNYSFWVMLMKFFKKPHLHDFTFYRVSFKTANKRLANVLFIINVVAHFLHLSAQGKPLPCIMLQRVPSEPPKIKHLPPKNRKNLMW